MITQFNPNIKVMDGKTRKKVGGFLSLHYAKKYAEGKSIENPTVDFSVWSGNGFVCAYMDGIHNAQWFSGQSSDAPTSGAFHV